MRGKTYRALGGTVWRNEASMRPPQNAGENACGHCGFLRRGPRFNEAPAECGGKPEYAAWARRRASCFNEAPAECGGKPDDERTEAIP